VVSQLDLVPPTFCAELRSAHGYSMLRPTLNVDYFHALYDEAKAFGIEIECHREAGDAITTQRRTL
jgi:hypothetical protein